ncbi:hypothetical protein BDL97_06G087200 [Sphagnum fallax]|nr:hypothetical protein BDL97_06G087200 [Sphagnum fallax]
MEGEQQPPSMWCNPNMVKMEVESNSSHGSDDGHGIHQTYFVNPSWPEPLLQALGNQGVETTNLLRILPHSIFDTVSSIIEVKQEQFEDATQEHHPEAEEEEEEEEEDMSSFKQVTDAPGDPTIERSSSADVPLEDLGGKSGGKEEEDIIPPEDDPTERRSKTDVPQEQEELSTAECTKIQISPDANDSCYCHQCKAIFSSRKRVGFCSKCKNKRYCASCIKTWYPLLSLEDSTRECPFCRGYCNCNACICSTGPKRKRLELSESEERSYLTYTLLKLLPVLRTINTEQQEELVMEAKLHGDANVKLEWINHPIDKHLYCDNCRTSIANYFRSCGKCKYQICLSCCQELRRGCERGRIWIESSPNKLNPNGEIDMPKINGVLSCHPVLRKVVGCTELLSLKTLLEPDWVSKLTKDVENILGEHNTVCLDMDAASPDAKRHRSSNIQGADAAEFCLNHSASKDLNVSSHNLVPSVASGGDAGKCSSLPPQGAKYTEIYCPHSRDLKGAAGMQQFQKHWQRGEPVRVKNSHTKATGLSWEPSIMLRAFQGTAKNDIDKATYVVKALDCLDRHQIDVTMSNFFKGYKEGRCHISGWPELLKLKDWPPSSTKFEERLPRHTTEFLAALPFQEYTDPTTGILNLAAQLPEKVKPNLGPKTYIAYGYRKELRTGDSVIRLHVDMADIVYVLMHTSELQFRPREHQKFQSYIEKFRGPGEQGSRGPKRCKKMQNLTSIGALWDVFQREDTAMLQDYLRDHSEEFYYPDCWVFNSETHPIFDQTFYLTEDHKEKLKAEYGVEPWTFEQNQGDAVLIPAGCPYQVRNLKSCIQVAQKFVSPEGVQDCIKLTNELRCLPAYNQANEDKLEVSKMVLYAAKNRVDRLQQIMCPPR